jgi:hypothetical protein
LVNLTASINLSPTIWPLFSLQWASRPLLNTSNENKILVSRHIMTNEYFSSGTAGRPGFIGSAKWLVGNGLCLEDPQNRLGDRVFAPHVLDAAKQNSVALINSVELYWLVIGVLEGKITDCTRIREEILTRSGYVDLRRFCGTSPFSTRHREEA